MNKVAITDIARNRMIAVALEKFIEMARKHMPTDVSAIKSAEAALIKILGMIAAGEETGEIIVTVLYGSDLARIVAALELYSNLTNDSDYAELSKVINNSVVA